MKNSIKSIQNDKQVPYSKQNPLNSVLEVIHNEQIRNRSSMSKYQVLQKTKEGEPRSSYSPNPK